MNSWRRFRQLAPAERRMALEAAWRILGVRLALARRGFARARAALDNGGCGAPVAGHSGTLAEARTAARMVRGVAARMPFHVTCLVASLALLGMLRRRGIPAALCIGARREREFEAHAWVECAGEVLNDEAGVRDRYAVFTGPLPAGLDFS